MLRIPKSKIAEQELYIENLMESSENRPLLHRDFAIEALKRGFVDSGLDPEGFREIRIAPNPFEMLKGNLDPVKIFKVPNYIAHPYYGMDVPLWFGDASNAIWLRGLGYKNGDKRFLSPVSIDGIRIHGLLAGKTGTGKSVSVNSMVGQTMLEYPPWEVKFILSDSKLAEFPKYIKNGSVPHVESLVASSDPDYVISMLDYYVEYMTALNALLPKLGADKFSEFREKTGLTIPRYVIVLEEFQMLIKNSKRKEGRISDALESIARLARSAGVHAILCSQDISSVDNNVLANMTLRMALGCSPAISEKILGNDAASLNAKEPGKLIVNDDPFTGEESNNINIRVPYPSNDYMQELFTVNRDLVKKFDLEFPASFFDESVSLEEYEFLKLLDEKGSRKPNSIYLGEPSFVDLTLDATRQYRISFTGEQEENILLLCNAQEEQVRMLRLLLHNFKRIEGVSNSRNYMLCADPSMSKAMDYSEFTDHFYTIRNTMDDRFTFLVKTFINRSLLIQADDKVFGGSYGKSSTVLKDYIENEPTALPEHKILCSELNQRRISAILDLCEIEPFKSIFPLPRDEKDLGLELLRIMDPLLLVGCAEGNRVTGNSFSKLVVWILGINRLTGIGQAPRGVDKKFFHSLLSDAYMVNMQVILTDTDTLELGEYKISLRYAMYEKGVPVARVAKMGHKAFQPNEVTNRLLMWSDRRSSEEDPQKFKKFRIGNEIIKS